MKNIVIEDQYLSGDLKPSKLLNEYIKLVDQEVNTYFSVSNQKEVSCPGCGSCKRVNSFKKFQFSYHECEGCLSLYVSPRPLDEHIVRFYLQSEARSYWNKQLYNVTAIKRQEKIIKPRLQWVEDSTREYLPAAKNYADINTNQKGYLSGIAAINIFETKSLIKPCIVIKPEDLPASLRQVNDFNNLYDVVSLFEVLDHTSDVEGLFTHINKSLVQGGLCFITAILSSGFDIKVLGKHAHNIYVPDRLNVFSINAIKKLTVKHGFELLELSTPGILDVDLVVHEMKNNKIILSPFLQDLICNQPDHVRHAFQEFLQQNLLSSYARVLIRKV